MSPVVTGRVVDTARLATVLGPLGGAWRLDLRVRTDGSRPTGWDPLDAVAAGLPQAHARAVEQDGDARRQAADLVPWTAAVPAAAFVLPAAVADVLPVPSLASGRSGLLVHHHADGWLDGVALPPGTTGLSAPETDRVAALVHAVAAPVVRVGVAALPITERAAWGGVVDTLTGAVLAAARAGLGADQQIAWERLERVVDALAQQVPLAQRPRPFPVAWSRGPSLFPVRATCCLHYRSQESPDRDGEGYCVTCPLRTDASRQQRLAAHLEETFGDGAVA